MFLKVQYTGFILVVIFVCSWAFTAFAAKETNLEVRAHSEKAVIKLPAVVVQGAPVKSEKQNTPEIQYGTPSESLITVSTGAGAKEIDGSFNELDIPLGYLEADEDISLDRRLAEWWLEASPSWDGWHSQLQLGMGSTALSRGRVEKQGGDNQELFEAGAFRDRRWVTFREASGNAFDRSAGQSLNYQNRADQGYIKWLHKGGEFDTLVDIDQQNKDVYTGVQKEGESQTQQESIGLRWSRQRLQLKSFLFGRQNKFEGIEDGLTSSQTKGLRFGGTATWQGEQKKDLSQFGVEQESWDRNYVDNSNSKFRRAQLILFLSREHIFADSFELQWHARSLLARDQLRLSGLEDRYYDSKPTLDVGLAMSTNSKKSFGLITRTRRFNLLPTPSQIFGDGVLLLGATELKQESGYRIAAGPWWASESQRFELTSFYEYTENEPLMLAVSPSAAKTINVGSVLARGLEAKLDQQWNRLKIKVIYSYQEALNNSAIQWQRGLPVPGRPSHTFSTELGWETGHWKTGAGYGYRSQESMDLSGMWFKSPHHDLKAFVGYGTKTWMTRLQGTQLMASANDLPHTLAAGQAGVDLLSPILDQTEVRLLCEWYL